MNTVITVDLTGQPRSIRLHRDAYDALDAYLDGARARLGDDPDRGEVIEDLERSIGDRLTGLGDRILEVADVAAVLDDVGAVETPTDASSPPRATTGAPSFGPRPRKRRLYRIREGQWFAGVCVGLAAYSEIGVDWIRTIFLLLTVATAGLFLLVYLPLAILLPVVATKAEWLAAMDEADPAPAA